MLSADLSMIGAAAKMGISETKKHEQRVRFN
jgi:hypothetical protein